MKTFVLLMAAAVGLVANTARAEETKKQTPAGQTTVRSEVQKQVELTRSMIQTEKQSIVAANLPLTDQETAKFWPLYREYQADASKLNDKAQKLILDYAQNYDSMTDEFAKGMLNDYLAIQKEKLDLKKKYAGKLRKFMPDKKVTRFIQIENKMDAVIAADLAQAIPLVK